MASADSVGSTVGVAVGVAVAVGLALGLGLAAPALAVVAGVALASELAVVVGLADGLVGVAAGVAVGLAVAVGVGGRGRLGGRGRTGELGRDEHLVAARRVRADDDRVLLVRGVDDRLGRGGQVEHVRRVSPTGAQSGWSLAGQTWSTARVIRERAVAGGGDPADVAGIHVHRRRGRGDRSLARASRRRSSGRRPGCSGRTASRRTWRWRRARRRRP